MMKRFFFLILISCACNTLQAQDYIISIAGCDTNYGYGGDGGPATNAKFGYPEAVHLDRFGNLYIAELGGRVRKINLSTGIITTAAGSDSFGSSGDGGPATNAKLSEVTDVFTNDAGDIFFADSYNNRIRKVAIATGIITTVAGNGSIGVSGDGGLATNAALNNPSGLCLDKSGNIFIADYLNDKVRKVDAITGIITTVAGTGVNGFSGNGGPATNAMLNGPQKVYVDTFGNIYISDQFNSEVRKVDGTTGIITNIAGRGTVGYSGDGGPAVNAQLAQPGGLFVDKSNNVFFAEYGNGTIRRVDGATGIISTVAGTGVWGFSGDGGPATDAKLIPDGVYVDSTGIIYIADYQNNHIRMVYNSKLAVSSINQELQVSIYPNPVHDELSIEHGKACELSICNIVGQQVFSKTLIDNDVINVADFPKGVYVVQIYDQLSKVRTTQKVVKE